MKFVRFRAGGAARYGILEDQRGIPPGVGPLARGDVVEVEIEGIGILRNTVV